MKGKGTSILINDFSGHAFVYELAKSLRDSEVLVEYAYCANLSTPQGSLSDATDLPIHRLLSGRGFEKQRLRRRLFSEVRYGIVSAKVLRQVRPEIVVTSCMPLVSLFFIWCTSLLTNTRLVVWFQDAQSGMASELLAKHAYIPKLIEMLEGFLLRRSNLVLTISEGMAVEARRLGGPTARVRVLENWAPIESLPVLSKRNAWAKEFELDDRFVFLYSGTLARKHSPEPLVELAAVFSHDDSVRIVVVSEGAGADWLTAQIADRGLQNLIVLPYQPFDRFAEVLACADALMVLLAPTASPYSVPSKTLSYLCAARPILGMMPAENLASEIVTRRANAGYVVPPDDTSGFLVAALSLRFDADLRAALGESGRRYAEGNFDLTTVSGRFLDAIRLTGTRGRGRIGKLRVATPQGAVPGRTWADPLGNLILAHSAEHREPYETQDGVG